MVQPKTNVLRRLKARPPRHLDAAFERLHDEVFAETDCLACANCCKTTSPIFTDADIERLARHFRLRPADFIEKFLHLDTDRHYVLNAAPCPFLDGENYCAVYDVRPKACREYPHTNRRRMHQLLDLTRKNAEICPAVARIVERLGREFPA